MSEKESEKERKCAKLFPIKRIINRNSRVLQPPLRTAGIFIIFLVACQVTLAGDLIASMPLNDLKEVAFQISHDSQTSVDGEGSIKFQTPWPTTICVGEISCEKVENCKLDYTAQVKTQEFEGAVFLELWCQVEGKSFFSRGMNSIASGTNSWTQLSTPFFLQNGQKAEKLTLNLVLNGKGIVWLDQIKILKSPLPQ